MQDGFYLDGYVYHMTHFDTLKSILRTRSLLSKERVFAENLGSRSIANGDVQNLRDRIYIWDVSQGRPRPLHSYVPFYFAKLTPMLYVQRQDGLQGEIIFFEVSRSIVNDFGVIFTDGNVTIQQLAKFGTERVLVIPATVTKPSCERQYTSAIPQGTNYNCSNVYSGSVFLENLDWTLVNNDRWGRDPEKKRIKHAEVLVPDIVPLSKIEGISTMTKEKADEVNVLIRQCGLAGRIPGAISNPDLYF